MKRKRQEKEKNRKERKEKKKYERNTKLINYDRRMFMPYSQHTLS